MAKPWLSSLWVVVVLLGTAPLVTGQPAAPTDPLPPPHVSVLEGTVIVDREGGSESAAVNAPLLDGDRIRTGEGRTEVLFPDGTALHLDRQTIVDILAPDLLRLTEGRLYLAVSGDRDPSRAVVYQIDAPPASVQTNGPGEYRLDLFAGSSGAQVELTVVSGSATLANETGAVSLRAGERARGIAGQTPQGPDYYNSARWDAFDRWSMARRDDRRGVVSVQYLPDELSPYAGVFDRHGTWRREPDYGYVWYPTVVADWRPYSVGYWRPYPAWDTFWVGADPWGWPTHHYGRWGFSLSFGWYWIPARTWGAAWVHWAIAPGYVSWCPLGYGNVPVFGLWGVRGHAYARHVDPWRGWTVMPRSHFGRAVPVTRVAVDGRHLGGGAYATFVAQRAAPVNRVAEPRSRIAVPRSASAAQPRLDGGRAAGVAAPRGPTAGVVLPRFPQAGDAAGRRAALTVAPRRAVPGSAGTAFSGGRANPPQTRGTGGLPANVWSGSSPDRTPESGVRGRVAPVPSRTIPGSERPSAPAAARPRGSAAQTAAPSRVESSPGRQGWWSTAAPRPRTAADSPRGLSTVPRTGPPVQHRNQGPGPARDSSRGALRPSGGAAATRPVPAPRQAPPSVNRRAPSSPRGTPSTVGRSPAAPRGSTGRAATPPSRGSQPPASRYNPGTAAPRGNAAPRNKQGNRRPPGRE